MCSVITILGNLVDAHDENDMTCCCRHHSRPLRLDKVAVKIIDTSKIKEEYVARNLEREARILSKLSHPSIVYLYETMMTGTVFFMVTELAPGGDLCTFIKHQKNGHLDEKVARRFGRQLVSAIAHMHSRGVVHRDLKMENIMLDAGKENIKIVDFGLSNTWDPDHALKTHCGSPEYAAPELFIVGQSYGPEVDLWSLGVVLYGMVTGRLPFLTPRDDELTSSEKRRHLLCQINRGLTNFQRKTLIGCSEELQHLISRLLVPNAQKRLPLRELKSHPWVVGRYKIRSVDCEFKHLSALERTSIIRRVAGLLHVDAYNVEVQVSLSAYGSVGGMFNILAHLQYMVNREMGGMRTSRTKSILSPLTFKSRTTRSQSVGRINLPSSSRSPSVSRPKSALNPDNSPRKTVQRPCRKISLQNRANASMNTRCTSADFESMSPKPPGTRAVKVAWSEHPEPASRLRIVGSQGLSHHFNQKLAPDIYQARSITFDIRSRGSNLEQGTVRRQVLEQRCSSAQTQTNVFRRIRDRPSTSIATSSMAVTGRSNASRPHSSVMTTSVTSTTSTGIFDFDVDSRIARATVE